MVCAGDVLTKQLAVFGVYYQCNSAYHFVRKPSVTVQTMLFLHHVLYYKLGYID